MNYYPIIKNRTSLSVGKWTNLEILKKDGHCVLSLTFREWGRIAGEWNGGYLGRARRILVG